MIFAILTGTSWAEEPLDLDKIVVTAGRKAQYLMGAPSNVTVITGADIQASGARSIPEILSQDLGVNVYDNSSAKTATLDLRGFGDTAARNVLVLVNGRKINNIDVSGPDLSRIPLEAVERIEMIRGAGSVLYGDNAVGGVINIITKKGRLGIAGRAGYAGGSFATSKSDIEVSGANRLPVTSREDDEVSYYVYSRYYDTKGYRTNSHMIAKDYDARIGYTLPEGIAVDLVTGWHEDDQGLPGGLSSAELKSLGRRGSADPKDFASTKDRYIQMSFETNPSAPGEREGGSFVLDLDYRNRDVYDAFFSFGENSTKRSIDTHGVTGKYLFSADLWERPADLVAGIDYYDHENDIRGGGSNPDDLTISKREYGVFSYLDYEFAPGWTANTGTRYHRADYDFDQRNVIVQEEQSPDEWVSMGGVKYEYGPGSNLFANVQQTFRFLATDEWYSSANFPDFGITPGLNTDLKQQTGIQYEAGIKHRFSDVFQGGVTPYMMDIDNEIFFDPVGFKNSNYDKTRRIGAETEGVWNLLKFIPGQILDQCEFHVNYTFQRPQFREGSYDGRDIPLVPRHQAGHGLRLGFGGGHQVSFLGRYVGSRFAVNDTLNATDPVKPYYVLDGKWMYRKKNYEVYAAVRNLLDEPYFIYVAKSAFSSAKDFFPAPERSFEVGMNLKF